jgi:hypothetical protein
MPLLVKRKIAQHLAIDQIDLGQLAAEFAGEDRVAAVDREIGVIDALALGNLKAPLQRHRVRIAKSSRACASTTTIAFLPSGREVHVVRIVDRHRRPGFPVFGLIGVRLPSVRPSALLVTHSVRRSHAGTTCCGLRPTGNLSTTLKSPGR